jgi:BlaI family transcriptional regulator, penicillinase repressor
MQLGEEEMKKAPGAALTRLELRIMQVIWRCGSSTVGAVQAEMKPPLAYTTVQTVLNILERKGRLKRELQGRAYVYTAKVTQERALGQGVRDLVDRMFGGSSEELVMSLLRNRQIDAKKLAQLSERFSQDEEAGS